MNELLEASGAAPSLQLIYSTFGRPDLVSAYERLLRLLDTSFSASRIYSWLTEEKTLAELRTLFSSNVDGLISALKQLADEQE